MFTGPTSGLWVTPNVFTASPQGSLAVADNVRFTSGGVLEPRRGMSLMEFSSFGDSDSRADQLAYFGNDLLVAFDGSSIQKKSPGDPFTWFDDSFVPNGDHRMRFETVTGVYFNPTSGIQVFDGPATKGHALALAVDLKELGFYVGVGIPTIGDIVTGADSGAIGTVGVTGIAEFIGKVYLKNITGTFITNEVISGGSWTAQALVGGPLPNAIQIGIPSQTFVSLQSLAGSTSGAKATIQTVRTHDATFMLVFAASSLVGNFEVGEYVVVSDSPLEQPRPAGNPWGLSLSCANNAVNAWMDTDTAVTYQYTIASKDSFGVVTEGAPSGYQNYANIAMGSTVIQRLGTAVIVSFGGTYTPLGLHAGDVIIKTTSSADFPSGPKTVVSYDDLLKIFVYTEAGANVTEGGNTWTISRSVDVTIDLPSSVTEDNFLRIYRSHPTTSASITPSRYTYLCYESPYMTADNVADKEFTFTDIAPDSTIYVPCYTNPDQTDGFASGINLSNNQPPIAEDIVYWANRMWYANTTAKPAFQLGLVGVGSPDGLQDGDTLTLSFDDTVTQIVLTGTTTPPAYPDPLPSGTFLITNGADPGVNIEMTAQAIVRCLNAATDNTKAEARYVSAEDQNPGKMLFTAREFGDDFVVASTRATCWTPQLGASVFNADAEASDDNRHPAGLYYSKLGIPGAVAPLNFQGTSNALQSQPVAADSDSILRIVPLHYRLLIFKEDGIYFTVNTGAGFTLEKLSSCRLLAPDSVQVLEDRVYCLTDQGITAISDSGAISVSQPIDSVLLALTGPDSIADLKERCVALAYRPEQQYLCWLIGETESTTGLPAYTEDNNQALVYSTLVNGYTRYDFGARAAVISPANATNGGMMIVAPTDDNALWAENKTLTRFDYVDLSLDVALLVNASGTTLELESVAGVASGDVIENLTGIDSYIIDSVDSDENTIETLGDTLWTAGNFRIKKAIPTSVVFNKITGGAPAAMKNINQCSFLFKVNTHYAISANYETEITLVPVPVVLYTDSWGNSPWGQTAWGNPCMQIQRLESVPRATAEACHLSVGFDSNQTYASFKFLGIDLVGKSDSKTNYGGK